MKKQNSRTTFFCFFFLVPNSFQGHTQGSVLRPASRQLQRQRASTKDGKLPGRPTQNALKPSQAKDDNRRKHFTPRLGDQWIDPTLRCPRSMPLVCCVVQAPGVVKGPSAGSSRCTQVFPGAPQVPQRRTKKAYPAQARPRAPRCGRPRQHHKARRRVLADTIQSAQIK